AWPGDCDGAAPPKGIEAHSAAMPGGKPIPPPLEPGAPNYFLPVRPRAGQADESGGEPTACLAYLAPRPDSELYAPFLVLVSRLWAGGERFGGSGVTGSPVFFPPPDDGSVVARSAPGQPGGSAVGGAWAGAKRGETPAKAFERIESFVAETIGPKLGAGEAAGAKQQLGFILGLGDLPDSALGQNPYGVAFSLARRDQLGLD